MYTPLQIFDQPLILSFTTKFVLYLHETNIISKILAHLPPFWGNDVMVTHLKYSDDNGISLKCHVPLGNTTMKLYQI